jgi:hypothetical protein
MRGQRTDKDTKCACLAVISLITKHQEAGSSLPRFHVVLLPQLVLIASIRLHHAASAPWRPLATSQVRQFAESRAVHRAGISSAFHTLPMMRSRPDSPMAKIGRKTAHDELYRFVLRQSSDISFYRYPASRPSASSPDPSRNITVWAGVSVRFAAVQKPSPLASQALGSGQS